MSYVIDKDLTLEAIPEGFAVTPIDAERESAETLAAVGDLVTDGTCGISWDDSISTSITPAPSGRCPFEYFHARVQSEPVVSVTIQVALDRDAYTLNYGQDDDMPEYTRQTIEHAVREALTRLGWGTVLSVAVQPETV